MHKVPNGSEIFTHTDTYYFYEHRIYAPIVINDVKRATIRLSFENTLHSFTGERSCWTKLYKLYTQIFVLIGKNKWKMSTHMIYLAGSPKNPSIS